MSRITRITLHLCGKLYVKSLPTSEIINHTFGDILATVIGSDLYRNFEGSVNVNNTHEFNISQFVNEYIQLHIATNPKFERLRDTTVDEVLITILDLKYTLSGYVHPKNDGGLYVINNLKLEMINSIIAAGNALDKLEAAINSISPNFKEQLENTDLKINFESKISVDALPMMSFQ